MQSSVTPLPACPHTPTAIPNCRLLQGPCHLCLCHGRAPVPVGHGEGHQPALPRVCAWECCALERAELGKTLLGRDVGNYSAVLKAQELRASNSAELVCSEALTASGTGVSVTCRALVLTVGSEYPTPALTCQLGVIQNRICGGQGCCASQSWFQSKWGLF